MDINTYNLKTSTKIITTQLNIPADYKEECINEVYKIGDSQNSTTNLKAIMSSYSIWNESKVFNNLIKVINNVLNRVWENLDGRFKYEVFECWSAIYKTTHYSLPHQHLPSHLSFVYYLKSNSKSSPLIFEETDFMFYPIEDNIIMFPSYLIHSVPPQTDTNDRICIAGNANFISK